MKASVMIAVGLTAICCAEINGQNLVPNPSFEDFSLCPPTFGYWSYIIGWTSYYTESADYFNRCAVSGEADVPLSGLGYQEPASGDAYVGMATYQFLSIGESYYREFLGTELTEALQPGVPVYVSFKASPGGFGSSHSNSARWACKNVGIKFYIDLPSTSLDWYDALYPNSAALHLTEVLNDTASWVSVSGTYVPDSAYSRLVLGNFFADSLSAPELLDPDGGLDAAYAFIDDVCVSYDPIYCGAVGQCEQWSRTVRPAANPFDDQLRLQIAKPIAEDISLQLLDQLGRTCIRVLWPRGTAEVTLATEHLPQGPYTLRMESPTTRFYGFVVVHVTP